MMALCQRASTKIYSPTWLEFVFGNDLSLSYRKWISSVLTAPPVLQISREKQATISMETAPEKRPDSSNK